MKILVYRDNKGFIFGPADKEEEIKKAVKQQEEMIDDQPFLVKELGNYKLVGEIEGDVFYAWIKDKTAFIESNKKRIETNGYSKIEIAIANRVSFYTKKVYKFLGIVYKIKLKMRKDCDRI